jgi:lysozyme
MTEAVSKRDLVLDLAVAWIGDYEGFAGEPYQDAGGVWTIGFGFTVHPNGDKVNETTPAMARDDAVMWLRGLVIGVLRQIRAMVRVPATDHQLAALTSLGYNVGLGALSNSTLLRHLNAGDAAAAADQFHLWCHVGGEVVPGLVNRRASERTRFLTPDDTIEV